MFGRANSKDRRVGGAAVDGGRYTQGLFRSQQTLSKKIHMALIVQKSPQFSGNFIDPGFSNIPLLQWPCHDEFPCNQDHSTAKFWNY
jgi:hypothetical protein